MTLRPWPRRRRRPRRRVPHWRHYYELTKPKVVLLIVFTSIVGTLLDAWPAATRCAAVGQPGHRPCRELRRGDQPRARPEDRREDGAHAPPAAADRLGQQRAGAVVRGGARPRVDGDAVAAGQPADRGADLLSLIGYAVIYTVWLKRATSQNIVIGGAAGAAPPVLGWAAVTNSIDPERAAAVPDHLHLDAAALSGAGDRAPRRVRARRHPDAAGDPRHPVHTRLQVLLYTVLLVLVTFMPFLTGMSGLIYLATTLVLNGIFLYYSFAMKFTGRGELPMKVFKFSVRYLMCLFAALLVDHYVPTTQLLVPVGPEGAAVSGGTARRRRTDLLRRSSPKVEVGPWPGREGDVVAEREQPLADRRQQLRVIAAGKVGAADRARTARRRRRRNDRVRGRTRGPACAPGGDAPRARVRRRARRRPGRASDPARRPRRRRSRTSRLLGRLLDQKRSPGCGPSTGTPVQRASSTRSPRHGRMRVGQRDARAAGLPARAPAARARGRPPGSTIANVECGGAPERGAVLLERRDGNDGDLHARALCPSPAPPATRRHHAPPPHQTGADPLSVNSVRPAVRQRLDRATGSRRGNAQKRQRPRLWCEAPPRHGASPPTATPARWPACPSGPRPAVRRLDARSPSRSACSCQISRPSVAAFRPASGLALAALLLPAAPALARPAGGPAWSRRRQR